MKQPIRRLITFYEKEYVIVKQFAEENGLGEKGFSTAVRMIVLDWHDMQQIEDLTLGCARRDEPQEWFTQDELDFLRDTLEEDELDLFGEEGDGSGTET